MKIVLFIVLTFFSIFSLPIHNTLFSHTHIPTIHIDPYGLGEICLICSILLHQVDVISQYREISVSEALEYICDILPKKERPICKAFILEYGKYIIELLEEAFPPDYVCKKVGICSKRFDQCVMFPEGKRIDGKEERIMEYEYEENRFKAYPPPPFDKDGDWHTTYFGLRGAAWRGRDCNDQDSNVYPGKRVGSKDVDYNCNGIYPKENMDKYCSGNNSPRGIGVIGDSSCAHFRIPQQIFYPNVTAKDWLYIPEIAECELDWPFMSTYTGYMDDFTGLTPGPTRSIYKIMNERNKCNHRDYQNLCNNGQSSKGLPDLVKTYQRNQDTDYPVTLFIHLLGNDVCSFKLDRHTDPLDFHDRIVESLDHLDTILPNNSYVFIVGLVDGRQLYEILHSRMHPLGITYQQIYDYLLCTNISMCAGWLNGNETIRNRTTKYAKGLNAESEKICKTKKYDHFKLHYFDYDANTLIKLAESKGYSKYHLVEDFDGFHPGQILQSVFAEYLADEILKLFPDALGNINPFNDEIVSKFGDQGGY